MMLSYKEFVNYYYRNGKCINQLLKPNHQLSNQELQSNYNKYVRREQKMREKRKEQIDKYLIENEEKNEVVDLKLEEVYNKVNLRDKGKCQLMQKLSPTDYNMLCNIVWKEMLNIIDHAHIFGKGAYPELKYDKDNIVLLNRYSHSMLDRYRHPITGEQITDSEVKQWWIFIVGKERYNSLKSKITERIRS